MFRALIKMAITRSKKRVIETVETVEQNGEFKKIKTDTEVTTCKMKTPPKLSPPTTTMADPEKVAPVSPTPPALAKKNNNNNDLFRDAPAAKPSDRDSLIPEFAKGLDHLIQMDRSLQNIINVSSFKTFETAEIEKRKNESSFQYLVRSIIGQQVSGAAAASILRKFVRLFSDNQEFPSSDQVLNATTEQLRGAGLSQRKAEYITGIAESYKTGILSDDKLKNSDDDEVVDMLVSLKGVGPWTADMFLLFFLHRMDTFTIGDLGVQRGVSNYIKQRPSLQLELKAVDWTVPLEGLHSPGKSLKSQQRKPAKLAKAKTKTEAKWKVPEANEMLYIANKFRPYRSAFQMVMWKLSDTNLEILNE